MDMQGQPPTQVKRFQSPGQKLSLLFIVVIIAAIFAGLTFPRWSSLLPGRSTIQPTIATNGSNRWVNDRKITSATLAFTSPSSAPAISPLFSAYYQRTHGAQTLGTPLTTAFPTQEGWIQFFTSDALFLPQSDTSQTTATKDALKTIITSGIHDPQSNIVRLSLLQTLLTVGSQASVSNSTGHFTYVDLRKATAPERMVLPSTNKQSMFIAGGKRGSNIVGHIIPATIWSYLNRTDISPLGWKIDFGVPLTEALPITTRLNGTTHHLLVQAFLRQGVVLDQSTTGQSALHLLDTGISYLRTLGTPPVSVHSQQPSWTQGDTVLFSAADQSHAIAHVKENFPLFLQGDTTWMNGTLWYHVQWPTGHKTADGWTTADSLTFTSPGNVPSWASFDALSPDLAAYLASQGNNVGVELYDITHQHYYTYNASSTHFIMGSSMKVPIMLTFFNMIEQQGREPTDDEMNLLTTMIENSNNDSASALYYGEIGGAAGVDQYLQSIHVDGLQTDPNAWGYSTVTPDIMVHLLTLLHDGKILTAHHRDLAFSWMEQIESDQQVGVGDTAPNGATVAMKDGWVPGPDDLWIMNSSGIVTKGNETYILSVYTQEQPSLDSGQAIARKVCSSVASLLLS